MQRGKWPIIGAFLAPTLLLYAVFVAVPYLAGIGVSLTNWQGFSTDFAFIGLANYAQLIGDSLWWTSLVHNLILLVVLPICTLVLALAFASLLTQGGTSSVFHRIRGAGFYRIAFFLPYMMPVTIIAVLWQFIYNPTFGLLNGFLRALHLGA